MFILLFGTDFGFYVQINKDLFSNGKLTSLRDDENKHF